jgi:hypothetical protein
MLDMRMNEADTHRMGSNSRIQPDPMRICVNNDTCPLCGMSGLEMLQEGNLNPHVCDPWGVWRRLEMR